MATASLPSVLTLASARFATVWPGAKLTFDASGTVGVFGYAVRKPAAPGFYKLAVVDAQGRRVSARVRIKGE